MTQNNLRYPTVLFDWGDTVMHDYPERTTPMVEWESGGSNRWYCRLAYLSPIQRTADDPGDERRHF